MVKVLIAFGSRYGSTKEIAEKISKHLQEQGIETQMLNVREVKQKVWPSIKKFDGAIIGSGIKMGSWTKEGKKFLKYIESSDVSIPIGAFVSCGEAMNPENQPIAKEKYLTKVLEQFGVNATIYDAFGGVFDLSENSNLSSMTKKILAAASKEDPNIKVGQINDGRNWNQIEHFSMNFSKLVKH